MSSFRPPHPAIQLLPEHALLLNAPHRILIAADLHLGKAATFRAHGLPIPEGDTQKDLKRLSEIAKQYDAEEIVIAGDLFHSASGQTPEVLHLFRHFLEALSIPFTLVLGNHDRRIRDFSTLCNTKPFYDFKDLRIIHKPEDASPSHFNICGHIHPVIRIPDGRKTYLRLPCFHLQKNILTIPSFGTFTGGYVIKPEAEDRCFVAHSGTVIEIPHSLLAKKPPGK